MSTEPSRRILVIDDEEDSRDLVAHILRDGHYDVEVAADGDEGITMIAARRPDLVVLDLMMPVVDGWQVLESIRQRADPPPVLVLTAAAGYDIFVRGVREGAVAYILKPFEFHELLSTCERILRVDPARPPAGGSERRVDPRRILVVQVLLSSEKGGLAVGELVNISAGGVQVDLPEALPNGTRLRVAFHIPGEGSAFSLQGRVQWTRPAGLTAAGDRVCSHGIAFVNFTPEAQNQLGAMLRPS
jgi:DNA-binding response OmpR family regulator